MPNPGDPQSLNRYTYALNNAVKYTDPSGHAVALDDWGGTPSPILIFGRVYDWTKEREIIFHWLDKNPQYNPASDPILTGETYAGALEPSVAAAIVSLEYGLWQLDRGVPSGADMAGTGVLGLAVLAGSDGKATPKDLYAFGSKSGVYRGLSPDHPQLSNCQEITSRTGSVRRPARAPT